MYNSVVSCVCTDTGSHHHSKNLHRFYHLKNTQTLELSFPYQHPPRSGRKQVPTYFISPEIACSGLSIWMISHNMSVFMIGFFDLVCFQGLSKFIQVTAMSTSFLFMAELYSFVWLYHILFIHSCIDEPLCYFYLLATMNSATINIHIRHCVWMVVFKSLVQVPRSGLLGHMVNSVCHHLRNCQTVFPAAAPFYIPTGVYESSDFSTTFPSPRVLYFWLLHLCLWPFGDDLHLWSEVRVQHRVCV